MPAITPGSTVLVSGASGFIAAHLCSTLLTQGYKVRGTVRSKEKGQYLVDLLKGVGDFEYVIVEDIAKASEERDKDVERNGKQQLNIHGLPGEPARKLR
jgi:uncharacterized protein YbjT (DUF2867 family)